MDPAEVVEKRALARQQPMLDAMQESESDVQTFYKNSVVFITGGSGFLGKQLIEKLLRSCQISKVYVLLRSKKEKNIQARMFDIIKDPLFESLRQLKPNFSKQIVPIEGDVSHLRLRIKQEDWNILTEEVNVIFHVAATTRFDEPLRTATLINVRGTREALLLGKACKKLRSYVHVSTAYSFATTFRIGNDVHDEFYECPISPDTLISIAEEIDPDELTNITTKFWQNRWSDDLPVYGNYILSEDIEGNGVAWAMSLYISKDFDEAWHNRL